MSKVKLSPELMLAYNELFKEQGFIRDSINTHLKNSHSKFGIVRNIYSDPSFDNFKIITGSNSGTIALQNDSYAVDKNGNVLHMKPFNNLAVPTGQPYYVIISYQTSPIEDGTVDVDATGILTGTGTKFTEVLRGQPNFPTKVRFYGSTNNTGDYSVNEVGSDTSAVLQGDFVAETGLQYSVIGTFTPTAFIPSNQREIYQYDSCLLQVVSQTVYNTMTLTDGVDFVIAIVTNVAGTVSIDDNRIDILTSIDKAFVDDSVNGIVNPLIGIESVKWDHLYSTRDKSEISISWGFRSDNWTMDSTLRKVTFNIGQGGKYRTSGDFVTGDFDGWRLYNSNGEYKKIITSTKATTAINLVVESLDVDEYTSGEQLFVCPDVEEVIIKLSNDDASDDIQQIQNEYPFPVNLPVAKIYALVPATDPSVYLYNVKYRYKRFNRYSDYALLPTDSVGYYDETSWNADGTLKANPIDRTLFPYTTPGNPDDGYIQVIPNPLSYNVVVNTALTGDLFGVKEFALDNSVPVKQLTVGTDKSYQYFTGSPLTLTADMYININSFTDPPANTTPVNNGNNFVLHFVQNIDLNGFALRIVQDYVNPSSYTLIKQFDERDEDLLNNSDLGIVFKATYDGDVLDKWILGQYYSVRKFRLVQAITNTNINDETGATEYTLATFPAMNSDDDYNCALAVQITPSTAQAITIDFIINVNASPVYTIRYQQQSPSPPATLTKIISFFKTIPLVVGDVVTFTAKGFAGSAGVADVDFGEAKIE